MAAVLMKMKSGKIFLFSIWIFFHGAELMVQMIVIEGKGTSLFHSTTPILLQTFAFDMYSHFSISGRVTTRPLLDEIHSRLRINISSNL